MLLKKVRAMLHAGQLLKYLWGEAVKHAVYLKNRTSTKALDGKMPYEAYFGTKPNLAGLHEFGCKVWVHNMGGSKLNDQSEIGQWVGFDEASNGHHIYWPGKHSISVERSVKFDMDADVLMSNSVPLVGENVTPLMPKATTNSEQPTIPAPFEDNPVVDHLGDNFEHPPPDQGHPKHIRTELAAIRHLHTGKGVTSHFSSERGELLRGMTMACLITADEHHSSLSTYFRIFAALADDHMITPHVADVT